MIKKNISKSSNKTFKDRVLECLEGKKPSPWGVSIGLNHGILTRMFKQNKLPRAEHLVLISKSLGKSINWLLTGEEHPLDKPDPNACMIHCTPEEQHVIKKLVEIFRSKEENPKTILTHNINTFCGDKLWICEGRPERRKKYIPIKSVLERRAKVHDYGNGNGS